MEERPRRSSEYFRTQARLCRDIAQLMRDPVDCATVKAEAEDYFKKADELEAKERRAQRTLSKAG